MRERFWINDLQGLYSKKLDESKPELFYDENKNENDAGLESFLDERCILSLKWTSLTIIQIKEDYSPGGTKIISAFKHGRNVVYEAFGDKILIAVEDRYHEEKILEFIKVKLLGEKLRVLKLKSQIVETGESSEKLENIAVCSKGKFVMVSLKINWTTSSSMVLYEILNQNFLKKNYLDIRHFNLDRFHCFIFAGYFGDCPYFSGFPCCDEPSYLMSFCYDPEEETIKEIKELRGVIDVFSVMKLVDRKDGSFAGIDTKNTVFSFRYE